LGTPLLEVGNFKKHSFLLNNWIKNTGLLNMAKPSLSKGIERRNFVSLLIKCTSGEKSEIFFPFAGRSRAQGRMNFSCLQLEFKPLTLANC
jgi:hypothetical protein